MNLYYFAAIACGALATYFAFMGASTTSTSDTTKIEEALKRVETQLKSMGSGEQPQGTASELSIIQGEFDAVAEEFYKDIPLEVEQQRFKNVSDTLDQVKKTRLIEPRIHTLELAAEQLTQAFNKHRNAAPISVEMSKFPNNIYEGEKYHMVLSFPNSKYWIFYMDKSHENLLQLRIARSKTQHPIDNGKLSWNVIGPAASAYLAFSSDQASFQLFSGLPPDMRARIIGDMSSKNYGIGEFDVVAKTLLERIVKYEVLEESLNATADPRNPPR